MRTVRLKLLSRSRSPIVGLMSFAAIIVGASCLFLAGRKVQGGLHGSYPSLEKLGEGDLIHTVDFRSVYAALLDGWLGCPAEKLLGGTFAPLPLLAT